MSRLNIRSPLFMSVGGRWLEMDLAGAIRPNSLGQTDGLVQPGSTRPYVLITTRGRGSAPEPRAAHSPTPVRDRAAPRAAAG
jgi:hypothetical protein